MNKDDMKLMDWLHYRPGGHGSDSLYIEYSREKEPEKLHAELVPPGGRHNDTGLVPSHASLTADGLMFSLGLQGVTCRYRCVDTVSELEKALVDSVSRVPVGSALEFRLVCKHGDVVFTVPPGLDASAYENGKIVAGLVNQLPVAYAMKGRHDGASASNP